MIIKTIRSQPNYLPVFNSILWVILLLSIISIPLGLNTYAEPEAEKKDYLVGPGDTLEISVYGEPDLTKTVMVSSAEGVITYPLLGRVDVIGLTSLQIEDRLSELLAKDYLVNPQVSVFIKKYGDILIFGQVKNPGAYELKGKISILEAIALAGGFTDTANQDKTRIVRVEDGKQKTIQVKISQITKKGNKGKDIFLKPGDIIIVPESLF